MRVLTQEQKAKAQERRDAMRKIAKAVADMAPEEKQAFFASRQITTIEGRVLSLTNQCMLAMQLPGVTIVGGFAQWIKAARVVRKGEHGLGLWVPIGKTKSEDAEDSDTPSEVHFMFGTVFDISQTAELTGKGL